MIHTYILFWKFFFPWLMRTALPFQGGCLGSYTPYPGGAPLLITEAGVQQSNPFCPGGGSGKRRRATSAVHPPKHSVGSQ